MSGAGENNRERLRRMYDRWSEGDFSAELEIFDPQIEAVWASGMVDSTVDRGLEELGSTMRRFMEGFRDIHMGAERIVPNGDRCFVSVDWHGTGRATELPFDRRVFHVWTFSGDRAVRVEGFWDELEALRAAGMEPEREGPTD